MVIFKLRNFKFPTKFININELLRNFDRLSNQRKINNIELVDKSMSNKWSRITRKEIENKKKKEKKLSNTKSWILCREWKSSYSQRQYPLVKNTLENNCPEFYSQRVRIHSRVKLSKFFFNNYFSLMHREWNLSDNQISNFHLRRILFKKFYSRIP